MNTLTLAAKALDASRFDKDLAEVRKGNASVVLQQRKKELERIKEEGKLCKNSFRCQALAQEYTRLKREYDRLDAEV